MSLIYIKNRLVNISPPKEHACKIRDTHGFITGNAAEDCGMLRIINVIPIIANPINDCRINVSVGRHSCDSGNSENEDSNCSGKGEFHDVWLCILLGSEFGAGM